MDLLTVSWAFSLLFTLFSLGLYTTITLYFAKKGRKKSIDPNYHPTVTIIVPAHNEEAVIERKLLNIMKTEYPPEKVDKVVVLDDNSTDETVKKVNLFLMETDHPFQVDVIEYKGEAGKARALNWILPQVKTDVVLLTDADSVWDRDSIKHLLANFSDSRVGAVTGRILIKKDESLSGATESSYRDVFHIWRLGETNIDSVAVFNGPLMAFKRSVVSRIDERCADDSYVAFEVRKKGYRSVYEPDAKIYENASSVEGVFRQKMRRARRYITILFLNRGLLGKDGWFGNFIYPFMLILHVILPFTFFYFVFTSLLMVMRQPYLILFSIVLLLPKIRRLFLSFLTNQTALALCHFLPPISSWEPQRSK